MTSCITLLTRFDLLCCVSLLWKLCRIIYSLPESIGLDPRFVVQVSRRCFGGCQFAPEVVVGTRDIVEDYVLTHWREPLTAMCDVGGACRII